MTGFPGVNYNDWRKLVDKELKGDAFDARMLTPLCEGITLQPIYRAADVAGVKHINSFPGFAPFARGARASGHTGSSWEVSQEINAPSPAEFNRQARNSLAAGLNALNMVLDKATRNGNDPDWAQADEVGASGLSIATLPDLERALEGIDLRKISLFVRSGSSGMSFAALLVALMRQRKQQPRALRGCIEMDPLGVLAHEGVIPQSLDCAYREMAALTGWAAEHAPRLQTISVHGRAWHEAGGDFVQELAFVLATAVEYLREMNKRELDVDVVAPHVRFAVTVGTQFFPEIAKLRALRMLWARAVAAIGGNTDSQRLSLHVRTSFWNKTTRDPYNNLLRATVEALAGVIGGCDSLQVGAFDEVVRKPDDFSRRIARNTQLILQKECNLTHVMDPAGGSWYVEKLTHDLAARAWTLFQEIEKMGGMAVALAAGFPQKVVGETAAKKIDAVNNKRAFIVGVNHYVNPKEVPLEVPAGDTTLFYRRRTQQVASHRMAQEDPAGELVMKRLAQIINASGEKLFARCVEAADAGATHGEIVRALRINDRPAAPIKPVCLTRLSAALERESK